MRETHKIIVFNQITKGHDREEKEKYLNNKEKTKPEARVAKLQNMKSNNCSQKTLAILL